MESSPSQLKAPLLIDNVIFSLTLVLVAFSIVMLYSTTGIISQERFGDPLFYVKRQAVAAVIGTVLLLLCTRIRIEWIRKASPYCFVIAVVLLALPLIPGLGDAAGGARRWAHIGPVRFQPGEFAKLCFVIFISGYFARHEAHLHSFGQGVVKPLLLVGVVGFLYLLEPDFGSTAVLGGVTLAMATAAGIRLRYMAVLALVAAVCLGVLILISPYRIARVLSFLAPYEDASGAGYQLIQSLIAVGSGQLTGVGLGDSQQKLFFLPAAHTDFIFAVIAEELGFLGGLAVVICFLLFLWRGLRLAGRLVNDTFTCSLAVGLTLLIVLPALLNIGVVIGVLPTKGMVLPLVGYGGSSLVISLVTIGILLGITRDFSRRNSL